MYWGQGMGYLDFWAYIIKLGFVLLFTICFDLPQRRRYILPQRNSRSHYLGYGESLSALHQFSNYSPAS